MCTTLTAASQGHCPGLEAGAGRPQEGSGQCSGGWPAAAGRAAAPRLQECWIGRWQHAKRAGASREAWNAQRFSPRWALQKHLRRGGSLFHPLHWRVVHSPRSPHTHSLTLRTRKPAGARGDTQPASVAAFADRVVRGAGRPPLAAMVHAQPRRGGAGPGERACTDPITHAACRRRRSPPSGSQHTHRAPCPTPSALTWAPPTGASKPISPAAAAAAPRMAGGGSAAAARPSASRGLWRARS